MSSQESPENSAHSPRSLASHHQLCRFDRCRLDDGQKQSEQQQQGQQQQFARRIHRRRLDFVTIDIPAGAASAETPAWEQTSPDGVWVQAKVDGISPAGTWGSESPSPILPPDDCSAPSVSQNPPVRGAPSPLMPPMFENLPNHSQSDTPSVVIRHDQSLQTHHPSSSPIPPPSNSANRISPSTSSFQGRICGTAQLLAQGASEAALRCRKNLVRTPRRVLPADASASSPEVACSPNSDALEEPPLLPTTTTTYKSSNRTNSIILKAMHAKALPPDVWDKIWMHFGYTRVRGMRSWLELSEWGVPEGRNSYMPIVTIFIIGVLLGLFLFMAGQYQAFLVSSTPPYTTVRDDAANALSTGPKSLYEWIAFWKTLLSTNPSYTFDFSYLLMWGAKFSDNLISGQWWRWFTSLLLHQHINHILTNVLLFVEFSYSLETSYGCIRLFVIFVLSGLAGNFSSTLFENPCGAVVGASGAIFGVIGMALGDIAVNFHSIHLPWVRLGVTVFLLVLLAVLQATLTPAGTTVSTLSHVGGGLTGLTASLLLLPNLMDKRWNALERLAAKLEVTEQLRAMVSKAIQGAGQEEELAQPLAALVHREGVDEGQVPGGDELVHQISQGNNTPLLDRISLSSPKFAGCADQTGLAPTAACSQDRLPALDQDSPRPGSAKGCHEVEMPEVRSCVPETGDSPGDIPHGSDANFARSSDVLINIISNDDTCSARAGTAGPLSAVVAPEPCDEGSTVILRSWWGKYKLIGLSIKTMSICYLLLALVVQPVYIYTSLFPNLTCDD